MADQRPKKRSKRFNPFSPFPGANWRIAWVLSVVGVCIWMSCSGLNPVNLRTTWITVVAPTAESNIESVRIYTEQVRNFITALILLIGSGAGAATLDNAFRRTRIQDLESRTNRTRLKTQDLEEETNRDRLNAGIYSRAIDQLGSEQISVRLGAIFSLEALARSELRRGADDFLVEQVAETLASFVKEKCAKHPQPTQRQLDAQNIDVVAAIKVIVRAIPAKCRPRRGGQNGVDLSNCMLPELEFPDNSDLRRINFKRSHIDALVAPNSIIEECDLDYATILFARLGGAGLENLVVHNLSFGACDFSGAEFKSTEFYNCNFGTAGFLSAIFRHPCTFIDCELKNATLDLADLSGWRGNAFNQLSDEQRVSLRVPPSNSIPGETRPD